MSDQKGQGTQDRVQQSLRGHENFWGYGNDPVLPMRRFGINRAGERLTRLAETAKNGNETVFAYDGEHEKSCFAPAHLAVEGHLFASAAEALDAFAEWCMQRGRLGIPSVKALPEERYALVEYHARPTMIEWYPAHVSDF